MDPQIFGSNESPAAFRLNNSTQPGSGHVGSSGDSYTEGKAEYDGQNQDIPFAVSLVPARNVRVYTDTHTETA